jgi:hypothetical protein
MELLGRDRTICGRWLPSSLKASLSKSNSCRPAGAHHFGCGEEKETAFAAGFPEHEAF